MYLLEVHVVHLLGLARHALQYMFSSPYVVFLDRLMRIILIPKTIDQWSHLAPAKQIVNWARICPCKLRSL